MNKSFTALLAIVLLAGAACQRTNNEKDMKELNLTAEWDKTFPKSDKVNHSKVTFTNRYGITLAADMYVPKMLSASCPPSPSAVLSGRSRNRPPDFMPRRWPNADF